MAHPSDRPSRSARADVSPMAMAAQPGYVPGNEGAGEEDPGAAIDLMAQGSGVQPGAAGSQPAVTELKIDLVSDVSCPWCAIGLASLEQALARLTNLVHARLHIQPFELNPGMPPGGQDIGEHLTQKYGATPAQQAQIRETIRQRGAEVGFEFNPDGRGRIYNTFDLHRLLHWAGLESPACQLMLKKALLRACHRDRQAMDDPAVLLAAAAEAGLDVARARTVLQSDAYAEEVRAREDFYTSHGIHAVPAVVINDRHLISGGQPVAVYEQALRDIAAQMTTQPAGLG